MGDALREKGATEQPDLDAAELADPLPANSGDTVKQPPPSRWKIAPHLDLRVTYDDNIFIQPRGRVADYIFTAALGVTLGFWDYETRLERFLERERAASFIDKGPGNYLLFDYTGILLGFARTDSQNAFDQDASFDAQWHGEKLTLGLNARFESKSEANVDVGGRVRRRAFNTALASRYQFTEKAGLEVGFYSEIYDPENYIRTVEWRNEDYLDYQLTPVLRFGFGLAIGRVAVEAGQDQTFERVLGRVQYEVTEKVALGLRGGVEFRQFDGSNRDRVNPVFDLQVRYEPAAALRVGLDAFRRVVPSAAQPDQDYTATGFNVVLSPRIREGMRLSLEGGYQVSDYMELANTQARTDHYFFVRSRLLYNFASWGNAALGYEHRENNSSRAASGFDNNQVSLQTSLMY